MLLAVGAVVLAVIVPRPARPDRRPSAARRPVAPAPWAPRPAAPRPTSRRSTACSSMSVASAEDEYVRLRPLVRDIARQRLADHTGVRLDTAPEAAAAILGPEVWELVRPDRRAAGRPARPRDRAGPPAGHGRGARADRGAGVSTLGVEDVQARCQAVLEQVERAVIGKREPLEMVLMGILADGHVLLEDYPGLAKTLVARSFAQVLAIGLRARPVHARPDAVRRDRLVDLPPVRRDVRVPARAGVHEPPPGRRDQPRPTEDAVGAARGDGRAAGDDRGRDAAARLAVPGHRHPEPDRVRGHLPAARGAARPLPDAARRSATRPATTSGRCSSGACSAWPTTSPSSRCARARS